MLSRKPPLKVLRGVGRPGRSKALLAVALLSCGAWAQAAELGRARMLSGVGQPLHVEIPIDALQEGRTPAHFVMDVAAGQASDAGLGDSIRFDVATVLNARADGGPGLVAVVRSRVPVRRPVVDLEVALRSPDGMQRRRIVLLLPSALAPGVQPVRLATAGADAPQRATAAAASDTVTVRRGDTASRIARNLLARKEYAGANLYQALVALLQANPTVFVEGNLNRLRAGDRLRLPDAESVRAIDAGEARRLYARHMRDYTAARSRVAGAATAAAAAPTGSSETSSGRVAAPQVSEAALGRDELRLSSAHAAGAPGTQQSIERLRDERVATQRALAEAQARTGELEANIQALQELLTLQNATLARLQQAGETPASADPASAGVEAPAGSDKTMAGELDDVIAAASAAATAAGGALAATSVANAVAFATEAAKAEAAPAEAAAADAAPAGAASGSAATAGGSAQSGVEPPAAAGQTPGVPAPAESASAATRAAAPSGRDVRADASAGSEVMPPAADATASWTQRYFWPLVVLALAFMTIVLALVFRKRATPVAPLDGVRRPGASATPHGGTPGH